MMRAVHEATVNAYAKINLFLDITGRRPDGYHTIAGVMQAVSLCDLVTVSVCECADGAGERVSLTCSEPALPADSRNLGWRAAEAFLNAAGITDRAVHIRIDKHIPAAAGLAGGSTDAAAVLRVLNDLTGHPLDEASLRRVGLSLGADVPFCLAGGAQITEGVGEMLTPCTPLRGCDIVIACAGEGVSTPAAYRSLDEMYGSFDGTVYAPRADRLAAQLKALADRDLDGVGENAYNLFESAILPRHGIARGIRDTLRDAGAVCAMMSGSGPSVFGLFRRDGTAARAAELLRAQGTPVWVCEAQQEGM